jgi:hypothetical protein
MLFSFNPCALHIFCTIVFGDPLQGLERRAAPGEADHRDHTGHGV